MSNYPTRGTEHFLWEQLVTETEAHRIIDIALWIAREAGMGESGVAPYALGMLASKIGFANRLNTRG